MGCLERLFKRKEAIESPADSRHLVRSRDAGYVTVVHLLSVGSAGGVLENYTVLASIIHKRSVAEPEVGRLFRQRLPCLYSRIQQHAVWLRHPFPCIYLDLAFLTTTVMNYPG